MAPQPLRAKQRAILERLDKFSRFTDKQHQPALYHAFKDWWSEAVVGLVAVSRRILIGLAMSGITFLAGSPSVPVPAKDVEAERCCATWHRLLSWLGAGTLWRCNFDAFYKANTRNTGLPEDPIWRKELA